MEFTTPGQFPMPGEMLDGSLVIASTFYREADDDTIPEHMRDKRHNDDLILVLLLVDASPYYIVGIGGWVDAEDDTPWLWDMRCGFFNIVEAIDGESGYKESGGDI